MGLEALMGPILGGPRTSGMHICGILLGLPKRVASWLVTLSSENANRFLAPLWRVIYGSIPSIPTTHPKGPKYPYGEQLPKA